MKTPSTLLLASTFAATAIAIAATPLSRQEEQPCVSGLHFIVARASTENPGYGILTGLVNTLVATIPDSSSIAVDYPATLPDYPESEAKGVAEMTRLIQEYVAQCGEESKVALMGYSQGAHVTGDVLCGSDGNEPLSEKYNANIAAVIQMGDPTHVVGLPFDVGNSTRNGVMARNETSTCLPYTDRWQAYCDDDDEFCDSGTSIDVHISYVNTYGDDVVEFVSSKATWA